MKKQFFLFSAITVGVFLFTSCKKQYSCVCSTTFQKPGYSDYTVSSVEKNNTKTTKKTAEQICSQTEQQLTKNHTDYLASDEKVSVTCGLK